MIRFRLGNSVVTAALGGLASLAAFFFIWLLGAPPASGFFSDLVTCQYREAGVPGPKDNYLAIQTSGPGIILKRDDDSVLVEAADSSFEISHYPNGTKQQVPCTGGVPKVRNIDQIRIRYVNGRSSGLLISHEDGSLAPGADNTGNYPMIEIVVNGSEDSARTAGPLAFYGSRGNDAAAVVVRDGKVGLDLNGGGTGRNSRPELFPRISASALIAVGGQGNDYLSTAQLRRLKAGAGIDSYLRGSTGDDTLIGGPGRDNIGGDHGRDLIKGLGGNDGGTGMDMNVSGGPGADTVFGGRGNDVLGGYTLRTQDAGSDHVYGGPGRDTFIQRDGSLDWLYCGAGNEDGAQSEPGLDLLFGCGKRR